MIITNVCLLLEALSIVICLHHLYGEKFRLDIDTICLLAVDMIMMQAIDYFEWPSVWSVMIYPFILLYCGKKFGKNIKAIFINICICILLVGMVQMIVMYILCWRLSKLILAEYELLVASVSIFLIVLFVIPKCRIEKLSIFLQEKGKYLVTAIIVSVITILIGLVGYKQIKVMEAYQTVALFGCIFFILILAGQLGKYKMKSKEIETELRMHKLYASSFEGLIEHIRLRQHEFDNHINTIYSQHYMYKTYSELVEAQKNYCQIVADENRFNKLLSSGNSIIIGFLYGKFIDIDKMGIEITYKVNIKELNIGVPIYKIVELLGNLIDNAVEALLETEIFHKLYVCIEENDSTIIEVRNESFFVDYNVIGNFFVKGYSKKGKGRGLGLYNAKKICDEYEMNISCLNKEIDGSNWLTFQIMKKGNHFE